MQLFRTEIKIDLKATVLRLNDQMFDSFFFWHFPWEVTGYSFLSWKEQTSSPHAFEIIDHNRPLLSEHKSQELLASLTFNIRVITPHNPQALLGLVSSHWLPPAPHLPCANTNLLLCGFPFPPEQDPHHWDCSRRGGPFSTSPATFGQDLFDSSTKM